MAAESLTRGSSEKVGVAAMSSAIGSFLLRQQEASGGRGAGERRRKEKGSGNALGEVLGPLGMAVLEAGRLFISKDRSGIWGVFELGPENCDPGALGLLEACEAWVRQAGKGRAGRAGKFLRLLKTSSQLEVFSDGDLSHTDLLNAPQDKTVTAIFRSVAEAEVLKDALEKCTPFQIPKKVFLSLLDPEYFKGCRPSEGIGMMLPDVLELSDEDRKLMIAFDLVKLKKIHPIPLEETREMFDHVLQHCQRRGRGNSARSALIQDFRPRGLPEPAFESPSESEEESEEEESEEKTATEATHSTAETETQEESDTRGETGDPAGTFPDIFWGHWFEDPPS